MDNIDVFNAIDYVRKYNNIKILKSEYVDGGGKINCDKDFYQLNIGNEYKKNKYSFGSIAVEDFTLTDDQVIEKLKDKLIEVAKDRSLIFVNLAWPKKNIEFSEMVDCHDIIIRHLIDYLPMTDTLYERRDILIKVI